MQYRYLSHGFYAISYRHARRLAKAAGERLPGHGVEVLIPGPADMPSRAAWVWLARTVDRGAEVWSVRDSGGWRMVDGRAVLGGAS